MKAISKFNRRHWVADMTPVLENKEAMVLYSEADQVYYAVSKQTKGNGFGISPYYHNFVTGDFKKCKKYFEKYSPETMKWMRGAEKIR